MVDEQSPRRNLFSRFADWIYAPTPLSPLFIRLTGATLLYTWWIQLIKMPARPYHVPAWRVGEMLFALPQFPLTVEFVLWGIFYAGAALMALGARQKWFLACMGALFIFFGSREVQILHMNYQLLLATYFVAFMFYKGDQPSCSRRLIQLSIGACYFYGAFGKLHPEWMSGETLNTLLYMDWDLREIWQAPAKLLPLPRPTLAAFSYLFFATEMYLAFAFFFEKTRKSALLIGILLHLTFAVLLQQVEGYSAVMLIGYMAFFEKKSIASNDSGAGKMPTVPASLERSLAVICALALLLMPSRYLLFPKYPLMQETLFDHSPWGFGMYLFQQKVHDVKIVVTGKDGKPTTLEPTERMTECSSDSEFLALAQYLFAKYPDAEEVKISSSTTINKKREISKTGVFFRNKSSTITVTQD